MSFQTYENFILYDNSIHRYHYEYVKTYTYKRQVPYLDIFNVGFPNSVAIVLRIQYNILTSLFLFTYYTRSYNHESSITYLNRILMLSFYGLAIIKMHIGTVRENVGYIRKNKTVHMAKISGVIQHILVQRNNVQIMLTMENKQKYYLGYVEEEIIQEYNFFK